MALFPSDYCRSYYTSPCERMFARAFSDTLRDFDRSFRTIVPYWLNQPTLHECNIGNTVGAVINDAEKFAVDMDVTQFHPEESTVNLRNNELVVEGHHEERCDQSGRIERHFVRKYAIPEDVNPETVESHLSDKGILSIYAKKLAIGDKNTRKIPIQPAPREQNANSEQK